jgi:DNA repair exonuclease SbcCD ATPase subunit
MQQNNHNPWKILEIEFSNMFTYDENNIINFKNYDTNKIIGILTPNRCGESVIVNVILFCLFNRCRISDAHVIMNLEKTNMRCSVKFQIGEKIYLVEKIGNKNDQDISIDVNLFCYIPNGTKLLNGSTKRDTYKKIIELIGNYDDFVTSCIYSHDYAKNNFVNITDSQRGDYLNKILKSNIFENSDAMESILSQIKDRVNEIINLVFDFNVKFFCNESNTGIYIEICTSNIQLIIKLASGSEQFIIELAIRIALYELSLSDKPNLFFIDVNWAILDHFCLDNINNLFNYIKNKYDNIIITSQLGQIISQTDYNINIRNENGYNCINNTE